MLTFGSRLASALGFVLHRHERNQNVNTHIGIATVLWDQTIKSLCMFVLMFVLIFLMVSDFRFHWLACKHEDRCKVCLENLIKIYSKIHQKFFQIASKKLPKVEK